MNHKILPELVSLAVPLADLTPDPRNARRHDERNVAAVVSSYSEHGQRKPIVVQRKADDGTPLVVRAGNGQCEAARKLGWTHIAAIVIDEPDAKAIAFALRDNRTAELAEWQLDNLGESLRYLRDEGIDITTVGWETYEASPIMAAEWEKPNATDEDFQVPDKRVSLMFPSAQWDELKETLGAKPTAEEVLKLVKLGKQGAKAIASQLVELFKLARDSAERGDFAPGDKDARLRAISAVESKLAEMLS